MSQPASARSGIEEIAEVDQAFLTTASGGADPRREAPRIFGASSNTTRSHRAAHVGNAGSAAPPHGRAGLAAAYQLEWFHPDKRHWEAHHYLCPTVRFELLARKRKVS